MRPKDSDRKKFCMSTITSADLAGSMMMGVDVVVNSRRGLMGVEVGVAGCVRSKRPPSRLECHQKLSALPMTALRWAASVGAMVDGCQAETLVAMDVMVG